MHCVFRYLTVSLTFIIASEAILNIVALSVTCLTFSPASVPAQNPSSSDKDLRVIRRRSKGAHQPSVFSTDLYTENEFGFSKIMRDLRLTTFGAQTHA